MIHPSSCRWPSFAETLVCHGLDLTRARTTTLQVNVGRLCNLACRHCHLEAGPARTEIMSRETMAQVMAAAERCSFAAIDITGGAPEMNPHIAELIRGLRPHTPRLLLRSNLVAMGDAAREELLSVCQQNRVVIVASFPALNEAQAESQRGSGVFRASLEVIRRLNCLGYGHEGSGLVLNLVSNPTGAFMPADQRQLEERFHQVLARKWGVRFNNLFSFVNVPLGRFRQWLDRTGNYDDYMTRLASSFNPCALDGVMCRGLISVGWDGLLYDCDFNQAIDLGLGGVRRHIGELTELPGPGGGIAVSDHCYACAAGAGFT
jgi:radical SAM/Cys-rich protein